MPGPSLTPSTSVLDRTRTVDEPGGDTSAGSTDVQLSATVEEVHQHLRRTLPATKIRAYVARAYRDLQGSVNPEALPEMAGRLAAARLHGQGFTVTRTPVTTITRRTPS
ncbi:MAG TPA: hypothetical protein VIM10_08700 [Actinopolymorphaceae bacterium]|jgi:hypothetical protein